MDDRRADICYISSDEESSGEINDDFDWLRELMDDDDDDVVFVQKENAARDSVKVVDKDDDDCVVLDEDPDKPVEIKGNNDDSDDLLVVSEKGQFACRDYPHSRHLCAKFPFASTPHENHCKQCHCYVCDSLAPCVFWENGNHCHATDEDRFWKAQRKCRKESDKVEHVIPNIPLSPQPESNHMAQNQVLSLSHWHPNGGTRILPSGLAFKRPGSVSQALKPPPGFGYYSSRRYDRSQFVKNLPLDPQSRQSSFGCSLWSPVSSESQLSFQLSLGSKYVSSASHSPVNTTYSVPCANSMFSQPQVAHQPYGKNYQSETQLSSRFHVNSEPSKHQLLSQPYAECNSANIVASLPQPPVYHPNRGNNYENQILPLWDNYYTQSHFHNSFTSQPHFSLPSNGSNCFPCQDGRPIYMSHDGQNVSQPANHISSFERDFSVSGETLFNQSNVGSADQNAQVDNSNFGNPAILGATQVSLPPGVNVCSPESVFVNSWNRF